MNGQQSLTILRREGSIRDCPAKDVNPASYDIAVRRAGRHQGINLVWPGRQDNRRIRH
jgi:hypothetical protein